MSAETRKLGWRRWREAAFATCTAWLVVQNVGLLALVTLIAWGRPADAQAAGDTLARTAVTWGGALLGVFLAAVTGFALAAWLVHAPATQRPVTVREVADDR